MSFYKYKSQCCGEGLKSLDLLLSNSKNYSSQLSLWFEDLRSQKWQWSIGGIFWESRNYRSRDIMLKKMLKKICALKISKGYCGSNLQISEVTRGPLRGQLNMKNLKNGRSSR